MGKTFKGGWASICKNSTNYEKKRMKKKHNNSIKRQELKNEIRNKISKLNTYDLDDFENFENFENFDYLHDLEPELRKPYYTHPIYCYPYKIGYCGKTCETFSNFIVNNFFFKDSFFLKFSAKEFKKKDEEHKFKYLQEFQKSQCYFQKDYRTLKDMHKQFSRRNKLGMFLGYDKTKQIYDDN